MSTTPRPGSGRGAASLDEACDCPGAAPLPPVRLAAPADGGQLVREVPLLRDAHTVVAWMVETGATATTRKACGSKTPGSSPPAGSRGPSVAWGLALALGLAEAIDGVPGQRRGRVPRRSETGPTKTCSTCWVGLVEFLGEDRGEVTGSAVVDKESLRHPRPPLPAPGAPSAVEAVGDYLSEVADDGPVGDLTEALEGLAAAGTVAVTEEGLMLTPHGMWGIRGDVRRARSRRPHRARPGRRRRERPDRRAAVRRLHARRRPSPTSPAGSGRVRPPRRPRNCWRPSSARPAEVRGVAVTIVDRLGFEGRAGRPALPVRPGAAAPRHPLAVGPPAWGRRR